MSNMSMCLTLMVLICRRVPFSTPLLPILFLLISCCSISARGSRQNVSISSTALLVSCTSPLASDGGMEIPLAVKSKMSSYWFLISRLVPSLYVLDPRSSYLYPSNNGRTALELLKKDLKYSFISFFSFSSNSFSDCAIVEMFSIPLLPLLLR